MQCAENDLHFFVSRLISQNKVLWMKGQLLELLVSKLHWNPCYYRLQFVIFMFLNKNVQFDSVLVYTYQDYSICIQ